MQWISSAIYPFKHARIRTDLLTLGLVWIGGLFVSACIGLGFLYIVKLKVLSAMMALLPLVTICFLTLCLMSGYTWHVISSWDPRHPQSLPVLRSKTFGRFMADGFQLVVFYSFIFFFLVASTVYFYPYGLVIPVLVFFLHPLLIFPLLYAIHDKTVFGLLDGCLVALDLINDDYYTLWASATLYLMVTGGVLYPVLIGFSMFSMVGILLVPGLITACTLGYAHLFYFSLLSPVTDRLDIPPSSLLETPPAVAMPKSVRSQRSPWQ